MSWARLSSRSIRRPALILAICLAVAAPAIASSSDGPGQEGIPPNSDAPPLSPAAQGELDRQASEQEQAERERQARVDSPEGQAERDASETKYADDSSAQAKALVAREFGADLRNLSLDAADLSPNGRIEDFLDDFTMRVDGTGDAPNRIVQSPFPLRAKTESGANAPVDERLKADGDSYQPANPATDVDVPKQAGEGVAIGGSGIRVSPDASGPDPSNASLLGDDKLFYANTDTDTDTVIAPITTGAELFSQLRSKDAPEVQRIRFSLPEGAVLRETAGGGAEVVRAGSRLAQVIAPTAKDAQGEDVPASLAIEGNTMDVVVRHRSKDLAYPILVDPVIENWLNSSPDDHTRSWYRGYNLDALNASYWRFETTGGANPYVGRYNCMAPPTCPSNAPTRNDGLHIYVRPSTAYVAGHGRFVYTPPGQTTTITRADLGPSWWRKRGTPNVPYMYQGILSEGLGSWSAVHIVNTTDETGAYNSLIGQPRAGEGRSQVIAGVGGASSFNLPDWRDLYVGGASLTLTDPENPTITSAGNSGPTGWTNSGQFTVRPTVTDPGLGVKQMSIFLPVTDPGYGDSEQGQTRVLPCTGRANDPCPATWTLPSTGQPEFTYSVDDVRPDFPGNQPMREGISNVRLSVADLINHGSYEEKTWPVKVDRTPPSVSYTGDLSDAAPDPGVDDPSYASNPLARGQRAHIAVLAQDASTPSDEAEPSTAGVRSIEMLVDGQRQSSDHFLEKPCPSGGCPLSTDFTLDTERLSIGQHTVNLIVTDYAGNQYQESWPIMIEDLVAACAPPSAETVPAGSTISGTEAANMLAEHTPEIVAPSEGTKVSGQEADPALESSGDDLAAVQSLTPATIDGDAAPGVIVDQGKAAICISPTTVTPDTTTPTVANDSVAVYANTARATDTAVRPTATGVEAFTQIRSSEAPETTRWELDLHDGQQLRQLSNGDVAIVRPAPAPTGGSDDIADDDPDLPEDVPLEDPEPEDGGDELATNAPPSPPDPSAIPDAESQAIDADTRLAAALEETEGETEAVISALPAKDANGNAVPTTLSVTSNRVEISVDHQGAGFAYPIVADPVVAKTRPPRRSPDPRILDAQASGAGTAPKCEGYGGYGGSYMHVLYAVPSGVDDDFSSFTAGLRSTLRGQVRKMNQLLQRDARASSNGTGQSASYRVLCDSRPRIRVSKFHANVGGKQDLFAAIVRSAKEKGFRRANAKYLIFFTGRGPDGGRCGDGNTSGPSLPNSGANANNGGGNSRRDRRGRYDDSGAYAIVYDQPCWNVRWPAHEFGHTMGAVQDDAPRGTSAGHCTDGIEIMCYDDGTPDSLLNLYSSRVCRTKPRKLDCNGNDYFDVRIDPLPKDKYLRSHWNLGAAYNRFLYFP